MGPSAAWFYEDQPPPPPKQQHLPRHCTEPQLLHPAVALSFIINHCHITPVIKVIIIIIILVLFSVIIFLYQSCLLINLRIPHRLRAEKTIEERVTRNIISKCLRGILNIRLPDTITNKELWKTTSKQPALEQLRRRKLNWIGHTLRWSDDSTARQVLQWMPQGHRGRGRPRNTWQID